MFHACSGKGSDFFLGKVVIFILGEVVIFILGKAVILLLKKYQGVMLNPCFLQPISTKISKMENC